MLKGNQGSLLSDARACLAQADEPKEEAPCGQDRVSEHGRTETRVAAVVEAKGLAEYHAVPGLTAFGRIEATRVIDGKTETDVRIFVLSRKLSPQALLETARGHWQIENGLHWQLDVSFGEDAARNRKDNGPANIAVIRRRALDVARLDQSRAR
jgi:predicted transposase YbfD/YdcC